MFAHPCSLVLDEVDLLLQEGGILAHGDPLRGAGLDALGTLFVNENRYIKSALKIRIWIKKRLNNKSLDFKNALKIRILINQRLNNKSLDFKSALKTTLDKKAPKQ